MSAPRYVSLFSGCGGLDLGFSRAGFSHVLSIDADERALSVLSDNLCVSTRRADLSKPEEALAGVGEFDILLAGPPCQGFSTLGRRRYDDPRNELLLVPAIVATRRKPSLVIVENVPATLSGRHRTYWERLKSGLKSAGYQLFEVICDALDSGVAQERKRIFLIASRKATECQLVLPRLETRILSDVLGDLPDCPDHITQPLPPGSDDLKIACSIKPGQKLSNVRGGPRSVHAWDIPEVFGRTTLQERRVLEEIMLLRRRGRSGRSGDADPISTETLIQKFGAQSIARLTQKGYLRSIENKTDLARTFNGKYRRLDSRRPSPTVNTHFCNPRYYLHPFEHRGFTAREAARIQGFPDDFTFRQSGSRVFTHIANAVPPPLAEQIARMIKQAFLE